MTNPILKIENVSKQYRLGTIGTGTIAHDLNRWWHAIRGKEDPYLKVGEVNDRSSKGNSDYVWALRDITFEVQPGEVVGIIGKNGAGKSTLLKILSRVTTPTTGSIKSRGRIASLLEVGTGFNPELTGRENIYLNGAILGMTKKEIASKLDEIIDFSGCERYIDTPTKRYSSGMNVRLGFAVAAFLEPEILVVDEVLAVGDAEFQKKAIGKMQDVSKSEGRTVLFVSHNMGSIRQLCTRGIVMENGLIGYDGLITESINFYLLNNKVTNNETFIKIDDSFRRYQYSKEVQFKTVSLLNVLHGNYIASKQPIEIKFELILNKPLDKFRIAGSIFTFEEVKLGTFFTNYKINDTHEGIVEVCILIENHNLAKGKYYFAFSVGVGDEQFGNKEFDIIYDVLNFEVTHTNNLQTPINYWPTNWGNISFNARIV